MSFVPPTKVVAKKKSRSPIERLLVWGLILVLLILVGLEAPARIGYGRTVRALNPAIAESSEGTPLTMADIETRGLIYGSPTITKGTLIAGERNDTYVWNGLKTHTLSIKVGLDDVVLGVESE